VWVIAERKKFQPQTCRRPVAKGVGTAGEHRWTQISKKAAGGMQNAEVSRAAKRHSSAFGKNCVNTRIRV
jgi:hypothetical protein